MEILGIDVLTAAAGAIGGTFLTVSGWGVAKKLRGWFTPKPSG